MKIAELHTAFASGTVSPVEVVAEKVSLAQRWQEHTPIFIQLHPERALAQARQSEARYRAAEPLSPLDGVLVGLKDLIDVKGVATTAGSALRLTHMAAEDSFVAAALRQGGANFELGKLNLHEFAYGPTGASSYFGAVGNPFDLARMAGGSSSGSAAAVAAGIMPGALGTDTGGSVRIPAALCGISGLKPTYGTVSRKGVVPLSWSLDHVGPMARTVTDLMALWRVMNPGANGQPLAKPLRIYWPEGRETACYEPALQAYVEDGIATLLKALGARVSRGPLMELENIWLAQSIIIGSEALSYHWPVLSRHREQYQSDVADRLIAGGAHLAVEYLAALRFRQDMAGRYDTWMEDYDAVILPTVPVVAPPLDQGSVLTPGGTEENVRATLTRFTAPFNFLGLPALSIPWGLHEGLPVGLQLVGRRGEDDQLLALGKEIQRIMPESIPEGPRVPE